MWKTEHLKVILAALGLCKIKSGAIKILTFKSLFSAARPLVEALPSQLVMSVVGALQQKTSQPLSGPEKFNITYPPVAPGTTSVTTTTYATITVASPAVTAVSPSGCNKATYSSDVAVANAVRKLESSTSSTPATAATVTITNPTGIATSVATIAFPKSIVAGSTITIPVSSATLSPVLTTVASTATTTTATSPVGCVCTGPSGIQTSPLSNQKPGKALTDDLQTLVYQFSHSSVVVWVRGVSSRCRGAIKWFLEVTLLPGQRIVPRVFSLLS